MRHTVQIRLWLAERDQDALLDATHAARELIQHAIRIFRGAPNASPADIMVGAPVPAALQERSLSDLPHLARCHQQRSGRRAGVPFPRSWVCMNASHETVTLSTPHGDVTCQVRLRPAQRRLLSLPHELDTVSILCMAGQWFIKATLRGHDGHDGHAIALGHDDALIDVFERDGRTPELLDLLQRAGAAAQTPRNKARLALTLYFHGEVDAAELQLLRLQGQPDADARVSLGLSLVAGTRSDPRRRYEHAQTGLQMQPDNWVRPWLLCSMARALVELGDARRALDLIHEAISSTPSDDLRGRARALYYLQGACAALEDFAAQERYAREALRLYELLGIHEERLSLLLDLAYRRHYRGDLDEAWALIQEVVDTCVSQEDPRLPTALLIRAEFYLLEQQFDDALRDLTRAQHLEQHLRQDRLSVVLRAYALECNWRLRHITTDEFLRGTFALQAVTPFDENVVRFYRGYAAFLTGDLEAARAAFEAVLKGSALLDSFRVRAAAFRVEIGRQEQQIQQCEVDTLLNLLERVGGDRALELDASHLQAVYETLSQRHYRLSRIVRPKSSKVELALRTLGPFALSVNGEVVHVRLAKARELLVWLGIHKCGSRDVIMDALWDGAARPGLVSYFKQIVHVLRMVLAPAMPHGEHAVTFQQQCYALHERFNVRVDATPFLTPLSTAHSLTHEERAAYTAPFFEEADSEWVVVLREQLQRAALSAYLAAAAESDDPRVAVSHLERAVEIDPLSEPLWMKLVDAWERLDEPWMVMQTRIRCSVTFQNEVGMVPEFLRRQADS